MESGCYTTAFFIVAFISESLALNAVYRQRGTLKLMHGRQSLGEFISATEVKREHLEWGSLAWFSSPTASKSKELVVLEVTLSPTGGHNFHKHPQQEEVIYVIEGEIEQWLDREKRILRPGDSVFIGPGIVHASFNIGDRTAKLLAILGPCIGSEGYELVDVADQEPWASLR